MAYTENAPEIQSMKKNGATYTTTPSQTAITSIQTIPKSDFISPIVGGYSDVTNLNSPFYIQAKSTLFKQYAELSSLNILKSQEQIVNGVNYMFYFSDQQTGDRYVAQVYVDLTLNTTVNSVLKNDQSIKIGEKMNVDLTVPQPGSWQEFTNLNDSRVIASQNALLNEHPGLSNYKLNRVESQIVSGINFRFFFVQKDTSDSFIAQVYYPFSGQPEVTDTWGTIDAGLKTSTSEDNLITGPSAGGR